MATDLLDREIIESMTLKINQKKSQNMFLSGFKILCHGYVIIDKFLLANLLIINSVFMSWLCHYWLPPVFIFQAGLCGLAADKVSMIEKSCNFAKKIPK